MIAFRSRTATGLPGRIEALSEAVELATDRLDEHQVAFGRHVIDKANDRLRHGTTHTLVAVLGATGSGKSSVANAVVGNEVATIGLRRPTTSSTLACIWGDDDADELLDWLEVKNRHRVSGSPDRTRKQRGLDGLVLLDVPDHDSVAESHREEMERIAEQADMLLWVTDPEKYADKAMHDYLAGLAGHGAVMAMVFNKADQLDATELQQCRTDLKRLLAEVGLVRTPVVAMSALTGYGVDTLEALLADTVTHQRAMVDRLAADTALAASQLLDELGPALGTTRVPDRIRTTLAAELVDASGTALVSDAVAAGYRRDAAVRTGWPFTRWLRRLRPHPLGRLHLGMGSSGRASLPQPSAIQRARSDNAIRQATAAVAVGMPDPWPDLLRRAGAPDPAVLNDRLDTAISTSVRSATGTRPRWWRAVNGLQLVLAAAVVTGAVWLGLLAVGAYLRIPEPPTPDYRGIPVPTGLLIGGIALGLLLAFLSARLARLGAARRARAVRRRAEQAVMDVADELVIGPVQSELDRRERLRRLLVTAKGNR